MSGFVSNTHVIHVDMLRICVGLVFIGLTVMTHAAGAAENLFARDVDILALQMARSEAGWLPYRLDASVAFARTEDSPPAKSVFNNTPRLYLVAETKLRAVWPTSARWQIAPDNDSMSLTPVMRFESKKDRIEIKPQQHAIWFVWRKALP